MQPTVFKGIVHPKKKFCHYLLMFSQTCINFFHVLNTKEDILKNVGNQTVAHLKGWGMKQTNHFHLGIESRWYLNHVRDL